MKLFISLVLLFGFNFCKAQVAVIGGTREGECKCKIVKIGVAGHKEKGYYVFPRFWQFDCKNCKELPTLFGSYTTNKGTEKFTLAGWEISELDSIANNHERKIKL